MKQSSPFPFLLFSLLFVLVLVAVAGTEKSIASSKPSPSPTPPLYVEGEAIVVFRADPTEPNSAEINALGTNFVNSADKNVLAKAVMENRVQAETNHIAIEPNILFDSTQVTNEKVKKRMENLAQANSYTGQPLQDKFVFGVATGDGMSTKDLIKTLTANPEVGYAEPNYLHYRVDPVPADSSQDGLNFTNATDNENAASLYGIFDVMHADQVWSQGVTGTGAIVANIDSIDISHTDLKDNIWHNAGETNCTDGADNDNNGFVDDCNGWDFGENDNSVTDTDNHGTHTSGTIAAKKDASGVVGVAPDAKIMAVKGFRGESISSSNTAKSIDYAVKNGADVISMSFGGYDSKCPSTEGAAIKRAVDAGVFIVVSSGNDGNKLVDMGICDHVYAVGAIDKSLKVVSWSGWYENFVDVVAPGIKILSASLNDKYVTMDGTSMSAPHVAGLAALMYSKNPQITPAEVEDIICKTADDILEAGKDSKSGCGIANAQKAVAAVQAGSGTTTDRDCQLINDANSMPNVDGYGVPFNLFSAQKELMMKVRCGTNTATLTAGNGANTTYLYSKGHVFANNQWQQVALTGAKAITGDWFEGTATANLSQFYNTGSDNFVVSYVCSLVNNAWKCGCRDEACTTPRWNVQAFR